MKYRRKIYLLVWIKNAPCSYPSQSISFLGAFSSSLQWHWETQEVQLNIMYKQLPKGTWNVWQITIWRRLLRIILTTSSQPHKPLQEYRVYIHTLQHWLWGLQDWQIIWWKSECTTRINTTACIAKDQYSYLWYFDLQSLPMAGCGHARLLGKAKNCLLAHEVKFVQCQYWGIFRVFKSLT